MFKSGDIIICKNIAGASAITIGKKYEVISQRNINGYYFVFIENDSNIISFYSLYRFEYSIKEIRKRKLQKLF